MADINVSTDLALCRACGKTCAFATLCAVPDAAGILRKPPPKGLRVEQDMMGGGVTLTYRRIPWGPLLFLIPFTLIWSGGSMYAAYGQQIIKGEFDLGASLFGIPFLIGTVALVSSILFMLFGKRVVHLDRGNGYAFSGIGALGWKRRFTYNRNSSIAIKDSNVRVNRQTVMNIVIKTDNTDFAFGGMLRDDAKEYVAAFLTREIRR